MTQGKASKEEAKATMEAVEELIKAIPKSRLANYFGHANDIFLFLDACERVLPSEETKEAAPQ